LKLVQTALNLTQKMLSKQRFEHSIGVAKSALYLGRKYGVDPDRAYLAGILHDIARDFSPHELFLIARKEGIIVRKEERACPILLHGKVGAIIVQQKLGIKDQGILMAISSHVTGRIGWTRFEQVLYLADKVESGRDYPGVNLLRDALEQGKFEVALRESLRSSIIYIAQTVQGVLDPQTVVVLNEISQI